MKINKDFLRVTLEKVDMKKGVTKKILEKFCIEHGLPEVVAAVGWSAQECAHSIDDEELGTSKESSKGWLYVKKTEDEDSEQEDPTNYSDFSELWEVIQSFIFGRTTETYLQVVYGTDEYWINLHEDNMVGKTWDFEPVDGLNISSFISSYLKKIGVDDLGEDLDVSDFLMEYADPSWGDASYDLFDSFAHLEFEDGSKVTLRKNEDDEIIIYRVNDKDVDPAKPFA